MKVRAAAAEDSAAIRNVHLGAFPTPAEAELVDRLVADGDACISIVAEEDGAILGHVLLSRMTVQADGKPIRALGLGPVAVVPARQKQGVGSFLVRAAISAARDAGEEMLFLLGEPGYYGRFGFTAECAKPFKSPYAGPYFQAVALVELASVTSGRASYAVAFADLG